MIRCQEINFRVLILYIFLVSQYSHSQYSNINSQSSSSYLKTMFISHRVGNPLYGINLSKNEENIIVKYTNPNCNELYLKIPGYNNPYLEISVYDFHGLKIYDKKVISEKVNEFKINVEFTYEGLYLLQVLINDRYYTKKIIRECD